MAAENDNSTNRFEVDGVVYETPEYTDLTIDDWNLVYDECQIVFMDFGPLVDDKDGEKARLERLRNPRLEQSFLMIGYMRAHPEASVDDAREVTGRARLVALLEAQNPDADEAEEADPPTGEPQNSGELARKAIAEKIGRHQLELVTRFDSEFGRTGRPARFYWDWRVGHILPGISPENIGMLKPTDLLGAISLFDGKYSSGEE